MGFQDYPDYQLWEDDRPVRDRPDPGPPQITMYDLRAAPYIYVNNRLVGLHFHLPRGAFDTLADNSGVPRIGELSYPKGWGVDDPTVHHLGQAILPAFRHPEQASRLFVDYVTLRSAPTSPMPMAACASPAACGAVSRPGRSGWPPTSWRPTSTARSPTPRSPANAASRQVTSRAPSGSPRASRPHRWLLQRRIDQAKALLRETAEPLAEIAIRCGFADQSHFTRTFTRAAGVSPGAWRRSVRT